MRWNESGLYEETSSKYAIQDPESGRFVVFYLNPETKLIVRSMFEEDLKPVMVEHNQSRSIQRKLMRAMGADLPLQGSEYSYFVVEKLTTDLVESDYDDERQLLTYESKIIGFATRKNNDFFLCLNIVEKEKEHSLLRMFQEIGDFMELTGGYLRCVCH